MKKQRKINKQRENNEMYCFCPYLIKEVSCFNHFPFVPFFPDVLSENRENTHFNRIYKGVSIVLFSFSIVFFWLSADISFVFRIFTKTSEKSSLLVQILTVSMV